MIICKKFENESIEDAMKREGYSSLDDAIASTLRRDKHRRRDDIAIWGMKHMNNLGLNHMMDLWATQKHIRAQQDLAIKGAPAKGINGEHAVHTQ